MVDLYTLSVIVFAVAILYLIVRDKKNFQVKHGIFFIFIFFTNFNCREAAVDFSVEKSCWSTAPTYVKRSLTSFSVNAFCASKKG